MIGTNRRYLNVTPGYSGHLPGGVDPREVWATKMSRFRSHLPGYTGHISGLRGEGLVGATYGHLTMRSSTGDIIERPGRSEFQTVFEHPQKVALARSQSVTVLKPANNYLQVTDRDISTYSAQFVKRKQKLADVKKLQVLKDIKYVVNRFRLGRGAGAKTLRADASQPACNFIEDAIPGYSGHRRKMTSENIFGLTFSESERVAKVFVDKEYDTKLKTIQAHDEEIVKKHTRLRTCAI